MPAILAACGFEGWREQQYLAQEGNRAPASASYKIFKKYGWNKVESGWSPFF